jgi:hypothetical protein
MLSLLIFSSFQISKNKKIKSLDFCSCTFFGLLAIFLVFVGRIDKVKDGAPM